MSRSHEPIFWGLFGAGGMVAALILPIFIVITGLLYPLGIIPAELLSFDRIFAFASSWWGALILLVVICFPLWLSLHRLYHCLHDFKIHAGVRTQTVFYGIAYTATITSIVLLLVL